MHNWFAIESEAEFRRQEWARAVEADVRSSRALAQLSQPRRFHLPRLAMPPVTRKAAPGLTVTGFQTPNRRAAI